jgi:hypothetical protein
LDIFTRTGNCFIRICKENLLDYQLKAEVLDIQKNESIYKLIVADDFANKVEKAVKLFCQLGVLLKNLYTLGNESLSRVSLIERSLSA